MWIFRNTGEGPVRGDLGISDDLPATIRVLRDQEELDEALRRAAAEDRALLDRLSRRAARHEAAGR
jgi:hypothetical protein